MIRKRKHARRLVQPRSVLAWLLVAAGCATIAYPLLAYGTGALHQARLAAEVRTLLGPDTPGSVTGGSGADVAPASERRGSGERGVGPARPRRSRPRPPAEGQALGLIDIPSIGLSAVFLEGVSNQTLLTGPGHLPWTGLPGSKGVSVLAAHRDMHFRSLKDVPAGARVTLRLPGRSLAYRVTGHAIVGPDARWVTASGEQPILRLVTCWPPNFIGPAPQRLVLTALPIEPAGRADPAGAAGDPGAIPAAAPGPASPAPLGLPLSVSGTSGDIFPAASLPWIGSAGASLAGLAAFGAWTTRRKLLWWFLPWVGGLGLTCLVLLSAWGGPRILAAG